MADDKYVVTKADGTPVDDAVVIRLKDPFAATALFTYANTILSFMELMQSFQFIGQEEERRLSDIADYFMNRAVSSQALVRKRLPD
jgi:hypothetical protein